MTTTFAREFLGWERPLLESAAEWLAQKYPGRGELDLSGAIVVVPGRRAGRRLLELLVTRAENEHQRLTPPRIETLGKLPEELYPLQRTLASDLVQQLTWAKVLRESKPDQLMKIVPRPPADDDALAWWAMGTLLWRQHSELAADGRDFGDVVKLGRDEPGSVEALRWKGLHAIQTAYLQKLDELNLWDMQKARLEAIRRREPRTDRDIVLVGTVDMNQATRQILDLVADRVTALIAAPPGRADWFDAHGCLLSERWSEAPIDIPLQRIRVCEGPAEQAEQVASELSTLGARFRADEIVIGLTDERQGPFVERQLAARGVATRWIEGTKVSDSGPCRLLLAVAEVLERGRYEGFASLVRHPDLDDCLTGRVNLNALDESFCDHLPLGPDVLLSILELPKATQTRRRTGRDDLSREVLRNVRELLAPLQIAARPLNAWAEPLRVWLSTVYGGREVDESSRESRVLIAALMELNKVIDELANVPQSVAPSVAVADAIRCAVRRMPDEPVPPESTSDAVELLGWLELPLDDTPAAIVTSFNDGFVPTSLNSDLFLPNDLRRRLGLNDNARRCARDAYAVTLLQQMRREVLWLVGRRDADGNPLIPSRLLFAVDSERLPERVLRLMNREGEAPAEPAMIAAHNDVTTARRSAAADRPPGDVCLDVPRPEFVAESFGLTELLKPARELTLSVTAFKSYLACPYRYFLRHELGLGSLNDHAVELDGLAFGNVLHDVLRLFGESDARDSDDENRLRLCLLRLLDDVANERYGSRRRAAVNVQLKQMESRLEVFATWQSKWRRDGWKIEHVERSIRPETHDSPASFQADGVSVWLHGRLDRIDRNESTGACAIFDYKSGDRGDSPEESHRKKGTWIDLQLPLYRHLARSLTLSDEPLLGYINLPKDLAGVGHSLAEWSPNDLADADEQAKQVALRIARREFWPPTSPAPSLFREFDDICQVGVFGAE